MNIGVSPLTHTIYAGNSKPLENGRGFQWAGKKHDVTEEAIRAVFEYMYLKAKEEGRWAIFVEGYGVMEFTRDSAKPAT